MNDDFQFLYYQINIQLSTIYIDIFLFLVKKNIVIMKRKVNIFLFLTLIEY